MLRVHPGHSLSSLSSLSLSPGAQPAAFQDQLEEPPSLSHHLPPRRPHPGPLPSLSSRTAWGQERVASISQLKPQKGKEPRHVSLRGAGISFFTFLSEHNAGFTEELRQ